MKKCAILILMSLLLVGCGSTSSTTTYNQQQINASVDYSDYDHTPNSNTTTQTDTDSFNAWKDDDIVAGSDEDFMFIEITSCDRWTIYYLRQNRTIFIRTPYSFTQIFDVDGKPMIYQGDN